MTRFIRYDRNGNQICDLQYVQSAIRSRTVDSDDNYGDATCDKLTITTSDEMGEGDRILYRDPDTGEWAEWVVKVPDTLRAQSVPVTTYKCVSSFEYDLSGKWVEELSAHEMKPADYIAKVLEGTIWGVGTVESATRAMSDDGKLQEYSSYKEDGTTALHGLCKVYAYEMYPTITCSDYGVTSRKVNLVNRRGSKDAVWRFEYRRDLKEIRRVYSGKRVLTKAHIFGKGVPIFNDLNVFTGFYDRKITIADKNGGKDYLEDTSLIPTFGTLLPDGTMGHTEGRIDFEQCEDVASLLELGKRAFEKQKTPQICYEASVVALQRAGMDFGGCDIGDTVQIVDTSFPTPLRAEGRVIAIEEDLLQGASSIVLTIGNIALSRSSTTRQLTAQVTQIQSDGYQNATSAELVRQSTAQAAEDIKETNERVEEVVTTIEVLKTDKADVGELNAAKAEIESLKADHVTVRRIEAAEAAIGTVAADYLKAADMDAEKARVGELLAGKADVTKLTAAEGRISTLESDHVAAKDFEAATGRIGALESATADIAALRADSAKVHDLTADQLKAAAGYVGALSAGSVTAQQLISDHAKLGTMDADQINADTAKVRDLTADQLKAATGYIGALESGKVTAEQLVADHAAVGDLDVNYAKINLANVNNAWIENGVVKDASIADAKIIGVSANKLTAGTIDASKINVTNLQADSIAVKRINGVPVTGKSVADALAAAEGEIDGVQAGVSALDSKVDAAVADLNARVDAQIQTWTASAVPTLGNYPASDWGTDKLKSEHVGDICYVLNAANEADGYTYRFAYDGTSKQYQWVLIKDNQVTAALKRLVDAEGDISGLQTFQTETASWITNTDTELSSLKSSHTTLTTKVDKTLVSTTQLWYSKANTTAPDKPGSKVTSTSTAGGAWRVVVPAYSASYPNYFYCYQWEYADGTFGWSAVTRDIAMGEAQSTSRTAASDASTAKSSAASAVTTANTAKSTADDAAADAATAKSDAATAKSDASTAKTDAATAKSDASSAVTTANAAASDAADAKTDAAGAKSDAATAKSDASTAKTDAATAKSTAATANTTANTAKSTADTAKTTADTAKSTADTAKSTADTANSTANTAKSTAEAAQATADANVKSSVQLWFTKANTSKPAKPTAHVTTNDAAKGNAWNLAVPTYSAAYPHYYYCWEYQRGDGSYSWSDVVYDAATSENQKNARDALAQVATKVETSTFNEVKQTAESNSATITQLTTVVTETSRNLLRGTTHIKTDNVTWNASADLSDGKWRRYGASNLAAIAETDDGLRLDQSASGSPGIVIPLIADGCVAAGETVTLSLEYRGTRPTTGNIFFMTAGGENARQGTSAAVVADGEWHTLKHTWTVVDNGNTLRALLIFYSNHNGKWIEIKDGTAMLERGDAATRLETVTNTVNEVRQTATSNSSKITSLETIAANNGLTAGTNIAQRASAIEQDLSGFKTTVSSTYATQAALNAETALRKGTYATCATAAGTAAKAATISPAVSGYALYAGATVTVCFNSGNSAASPTLNVNGTGAKKIVVNGTENPPAAHVRWGAYATCTFVYDGTYWRFAGSDQEAVRISSAETSITQNADAIALKASQSDLTSLSGKVSQLELTASGLTVKVDSIAVGGRNLLKGSAQVYKGAGTHGWRTNGNGEPDVAVVDGRECLHLEAAVTGAMIPLIRTNSRIGLEWGGTYTVAAWLMLDREWKVTSNSVPLHYHCGSVATDDEFDLSINGKGGGVTHALLSPPVGTIVPANTWQRIEAVVKTAAAAPSAAYPRPVYAPFIYGGVRTESGGDTVNVWMRGYKFEKGTMATDWTPAPEDLEAASADAANLARDARAGADRARAGAADAQAAATAAGDAADGARHAAEGAASAASDAAKAAAIADGKADAAQASADAAAGNAAVADGKAQAAQASADAAQAAADKANRAIDGDGTSPGLSQRVREVSSTLTQTAERLTYAVDTLDSLGGDVRAWFDFGADASGDPLLTIGSTRAAATGQIMSTEISNHSMAFKDGGSAVMELDGLTSTVRADNVDVAQALKVGRYRWAASADGTGMTLVYVEG